MIEILLRGKRFIGPALFLLCVMLGGVFLFALRPPHVTTDIPQEFEVQPGEGFTHIIDRLKDNGLIRSAWATKFFSLFEGIAFRMQPGVYLVEPGLASPEILSLFSQGLRRETEVTIPEGATLLEIDALLHEKGVIAAGALIAFGEKVPEPLEGKLFPDSYRFFARSSPKEVVEKFLDNFEKKAVPLFENSENFTRDLTLASLIEREVPDPEDRRIVAGILLRRAAAGMSLQVDATICYIKELAAHAPTSCLPISDLDLELDSPYNTYLYAGWPPGPIGNPGKEAIRAALEPRESSYWFYLSDPKTKKTVFSRTFEEHTRNRTTYLP